METTTSSRTAKAESLAGMLSGMIGKVCDHPMDMLKTKMQAMMKARAARRAAAAAAAAGASSSQTTMGTQPQSSSVANKTSSPGSVSPAGTSSGTGNLSASCVKKVAVNSAEFPSNPSPTASSNATAVAPPVEQQQQQKPKRRVKANAPKNSNKMGAPAAAENSTTSTAPKKAKSTSRARPLPPVTARRCATDIFKKEGFFGFYRGLASPLVGAAFEASVAFTTFNRTLCGLSAVASSLTSTVAVAEVEGKSTCKQETGAVVLSSSSLNCDENNISSSALPPMSHVVLAGMAAGLGTSLILTPVELIKCRMQLPPRRYPYKNTLDCILRTARKDGLRAFGRGGLATLAREVPGNAAWFGTYETCLRNVFGAGCGVDRDRLAWYAIPVSGAVAGLSYTLAFYPADVVKTYVQTDKGFAKLSLGESIRKLYVAGGVRALYCGVGIAAARQIPSNAAIFTTYECVMRHFSKSEK